MRKLGRRIITVLIVLLFSIECAGLEHLSLLAYAEQDGLRPAATLVSGKADGAVKNSSAGETDNKPAFSARKSILYAAERGSIKNAAIFVLSIMGAFYVTLQLSKSLPITLSVTAAVTFGELVYFGFVPYYIDKYKQKKRLIMAERARKEDKAQKAIERQLLLEEANEILNEIFEENPPSEFNTYQAFGKATDGAVEKKLSSKQQSLVEVKSRIDGFKAKAGNYFAQKKTEERQRLLDRTNEMLDDIFKENPPPQFESYEAFAGSVDRAVRKRLSNEQQNMREISLRIEKVRAGARDYFAQKEAEEERAKRARELAEAGRELSEKKTVLEEAETALGKAEEKLLGRVAELKDNLKSTEDFLKEREQGILSNKRQVFDEAEAGADRSRQQLLGRLAQEEEKLSDIQRRLEEFKQGVDAKIAKLKVRGIRKLGEVDWRSCRTAVEFVGRLEAATAPEVKDDPEIKGLFENLKTAGVDKINERNKKLLIICKDELSKVIPGKCKNKEDFLAGLGQIRQKFLILPNIDARIVEKSKEWRAYEESAVAVERLEGVFVEELYTTEERTHLQKTAAAVELYSFILKLPVEMRREWLDRFYSELNKRYLQIADEQLRVLREGRFKSPVAESRPVKIIDYILDWLAIQIEKQGYDKLRPECKRISSELYKAKKEARPGEERPAEPLAAPGLSPELEEAADEVVEEMSGEAERLTEARKGVLQSLPDKSFKETLDTASQMFDEVRNIPQQAVAISECCEIFLLLHDMEARGKSKARLEKLKKKVMERIKQIAKGWAADGKTLDKEEIRMLEGLPKIVGIIYIIAASIDLNNRVAAILWEKEGYPEVNRLLKAGKIDPAKMQQVMGKLKEYNIFKKSKFEKKGTVIVDLFIPLFVLRKAGSFIANRRFPGSGSDEDISTLRSEYADKDTGTETQPDKSAVSKGSPAILDELQDDISQKASSAGLAEEKSISAVRIQENTGSFSLEVQPDINIAINSAA